MAWNDGVTRATGDLILAADWNAYLGATGSLMQLKSHAHGGTTGEGSQSLGPLVLGDFTTAAAPAAPGASKGRFYSVTGDKPGWRGGAAGGATVIALGEVVRKTADESVTNSTALQNDDALLFALAANEVCAFDGALFITGTGDFRFAFTVPAGATVLVGANGVASSANSTDGNIHGTWEAGSATALNGFEAAGGTGQLIPIRGLVVNGANAGNLQLQWAQNVADGSPVTVKAGSWLRRQWL